MFKLLWRLLTDLFIVIWLALYGVWFAFGSEGFPVGWGFQVGLNVLMFTAAIIWLLIGFIDFLNYRYKI